MSHLTILLSIATLFSSTSAFSGQSLLPLCLATLFTIFAILVTYNRTYDEGSTPISQLACYEDGTGMVPEYLNPEGKTISSFSPRIMGVEKIIGPDSLSCGSCIMLEYEGRARAFLAVTGSESGIELSLEGMDALTGGRAEALGRIDVTATRVALLNCGLVRSFGEGSDL